jgi:UDP-N-acetylglucosamine transferase subunit ALG13
VARREAQAVKKSVSPIAPTRGLDLSECDGIVNVGDFVDFDSLINYLKQSSRAGLAASQLIAIKVDTIEDIYSRANADEFMYALREVACAITETFHAKGCLIAYAGDGIFVVASKSPTPLLAVEIESQVQNLLDDRNVEYDSGNPMDIEVSVGNPIRPSLSDLAEVPRSVERAIARAKARAETKNDRVQAMNIRRF